MDIFRNLHKQGNTIVLITHDENVAKQADRSIKILDGHVYDTSHEDSSEDVPEEQKAEEETRQSRKEGADK